MLDCVACGTCCFGLRVVLDPEDEALLTAEEILTLTKIESIDDIVKGRSRPNDEDVVVRSMKTRPDKSCVALKVEDGRYLCSIYERRPHVCREYESGGRRCVELRETRGITRGAPEPPRK